MPLNIWLCILGQREKSSWLKTKRAERGIDISTNCNRWIFVFKVAVTCYCTSVHVSGVGYSYLSTRRKYWIILNLFLIHPTRPMIIYKPYLIALIPLVHSLSIFIRILKTWCRNIGTSRNRETMSETRIDKKMIEILIFEPIIVILEG